jgi:hypothetical protein
MTSHLGPYQLQVYSIFEFSWADSPYEHLVKNQLMLNSISQGSFGGPSLSS